VPNYSLESARQIAENVSTAIVPSSGHWIPEEQPKALVDLILNFFNEKVQYPSSDATNTANAIKDLVRTIDNGSLLQPQTNNFTTTLNPPPSANISTGPVQNQTGDSRNISISRSAGSNLTTGAELVTNQTSLPGNGSSPESATNAEGLPGEKEGEDSVVDQGTPLSEAIEAISKLFGRNSGS
jgi:hypothetical protein